MAISRIGQVGSGSATTAGTTITVANTLGQAIPAGTLIHITGTWDNINNVTAPTITCSTIGGTTATANHAMPIGSGVTTTAGSGVWHTCFRAVTTASIAIGATIATLTSNQSAVKRAAVAHGWVGASATARGTVTTAVSTAGTPSAASTGTALVAGDLVIGSISYENNAAPTADTDTTNGSWTAVASAFTTGGSAVTNVGAASQGKVVTATGAQTYNATAAADSIACIYSVQPGTAAPAISTLVDAFDSIADTPPWDIWSSGVSVVAGQLNILPTSQNTTYRGLNRTDVYTMRGSTIYAELVSAGNQSLTTWEAFPVVLSNIARTARLQWYVTGSKLCVNGTAPLGTVYEDTYDPVAHRWLQIRESGGTIYFEVSPSGKAGTWSVWHSRATTAVPTDLDLDWVLFEASAGTYSSEAGATTALVIDNLNNQPPQGGPATGAFTFAGSAAGVTPLVIPAVTQAAYRFYSATNAEAGALSVGWLEDHGNSFVAPIDLPAEGAGESFIGTGQPLVQGGFLVRKQGSPTGTLTAKVYAHTGTYGAMGSVPTGVALAVSTTTVDIAGLPASAQGQVHGAAWRFFDFDGTFTPANGTAYFFVVESDGAAFLDASNYITFIINGAPSSYAGRSAIYAAGAWSSTNDWDILLQLITGTGALADQNTVYTADLSAGDANLQLRMQLQSTNTTPIGAADDWQLQWEKNASGTWSDVVGTMAYADGYPAYNSTSGTGSPSATNPSVAHSIVGDGRKLLRFGCKIGRGATVPDGTLAAVLYAWTGTQSGGLPTGTPLATSTTVKVGTDFTTTSAWTDFDFDPTFTLVDGVVYGIGVLATGLTVSNYVFMHDSSSPTHAGRQVSFNGTTWASTTSDSVFEVWTQPEASPSTVIPYAAPNLVDYGGLTLNRLTGGTGTFVPGKVAIHGRLAYLTWTANNFTEVLYSVTLRKADLANADTLRFRVVRNGSTDGLTYTQYPSITVNTSVPSVGTSTGAFSFAGSAIGAAPVVATTLANWFNGAASGTALSVANSDDGGGSTFGLVQVTGDIVGKFSNAYVLHPVLSPTSLRITNAADGTTTTGVTYRMEYDWTATPAQAIAFDLWLYLPSATWLAQQQIGQVYDTSTLSKLTVFLQADRTIRLYDANATAIATSPAVPFDTWYRVSVWVKTGTTTANGQLQLQTGPAFDTPVYTSALATTANTRTDPAARLRFGKLSSAELFNIVHFGGVRAGLNAPTFLPDPTLPTLPNAGTVTGAFSFAGAASGTKPVVPIKTGTSTGAVNFVGSATGKATRKATVTGAVTWAGAAVGKETPKGTVTGAVTWAGTAIGKRTPKATATGAVSWAGAATGVKPGVPVKTGTVTGAVTWVGAASGKFPAKATSTGVFSFVGAASGIKPVVPVKTGTASGAVNWVGTAGGKTAPKATVTGAIVWAGSVLDKMVTKGTSTGAFAWAGSATGATAPSIPLLTTPISRTPLSYWNGTAWVPVDAQGLTGPQGVQGPEGVRTSSGGCRFRGSQTVQPSGAIWDVDNFIVESMSTDPNPCMGLVSSNDMSVLRNTSSLIITATVAITSTRVSSRSYVAIILAPSGGILGRTSLLPTEDSVTLTVMAQLALGDKVRVQTYLNTVASPIAYTCYVTAVLAP